MCIGGVCAPVPCSIHLCRAGFPDSLKETQLCSRPQGLLLRGRVGYPPHRWRDGCSALPADISTLSGALTPAFPAGFFPNLTLACVCVTAAQRRNGAAERQRAAELRAAGSAPLEFTVLLHSFHVWSSDKQLGRKANRGKRRDFLAG